MYEYLFGELHALAIRYKKYKIVENFNTKNTKTF